MAESLREKGSGSTISRVVNENSINVECAVCLQSCIHPAELPCGHIFCYLCIKGIVNQGRRCAMCRQDIPVDYLDKPRLLKPVDIEVSSQGFEDGHLWFYEGHNGWWQYDERTSVELESAYQKGERCCELLIAGFLYIADFDAMLQYRRNDPSRRRRIKRDLATITKKGVAGLKALKDCNATTSDTPDLVSNILLPGTQSLQISGQPTTDHLNDRRSLTISDSIPNIFDLHQPVQGYQIPRNRNSTQTSSPLTSTSNSVNLTNNSILNSQTENDDTFYSRNFELDNMIHDTLDWTIQQIESLNLELSNDYENLFRDVDSYGQLQDILDHNRSSRIGTDRWSVRPSSGSRLNRSLENELDSSDRTSSSVINRSEGNIPSVEHPELPPEEINSTSSVRQRFLNRPALLSRISSQTPVARNTSALRSRRTSPRRCSSLRDNETLF